MTETDINFLRRQAEHCVALSRATFDLTIAGRLRAMADEFRARASKWEDEMLSVPAPALGHNGSSNGRTSRD
jgi:hypothetical protein